jgi:hypothetical protein
LPVARSPSRLSWRSALLDCQGAKPSSSCKCSFVTISGTRANAHRRRLRRLCQLSGTARAAGLSLHGRQSVQSCGFRDELTSEKLSVRIYRRALPIVADENFSEGAIVSMEEQPFVGAKGDIEVVAGDFELSAKELMVSLGRKADGLCIASSRPSSQSSLAGFPPGALAHALIDAVKVRSCLVSRLHRLSPKSIFVSFSLSRAATDSVFNTGSGSSFFLSPCTGHRVPGTMFRHELAGAQGRRADVAARVTTADLSPEPACFHHLADRAIYMRDRVVRFRSEPAKRRGALEVPIIVVLFESFHNAPLTFRPVFGTDPPHRRIALAPVHGLGHQGARSFVRMRRPSCRRCEKIKLQKENGARRSALDRGQASISRADANGANDRTSGERSSRIDPHLAHTTRL